MSMSVTDAVKKRMSVRAYRPDPVPSEILREILEVARRAPSGGNVQPWKVDVLTGKALAEFKEIVGEKVRSGVKETLQYDIYPPKLWEPHRTYRYELGEAMYDLIGVARDNKLGRLLQFARNFQFFDAPAAMFFTLSQRFGPPQWSDVGMLMQTIMLLAVERGLDTCPQEAWSQFPETVKSYLGLDADALVFAGMAIGYRDEDHPINRLKSERASVDDFATFHE